MSSVSIIMPVYNGVAHIKQAIDSVLDQTWTDFELLIVDDGSTDGTAQVISGYVDPRIHYQFQINQGPSAARNAGIDMVQTQYLSFLDADDKWDPTFLDQCLAMLRTDESVAGVYTGSAFLDETSEVLPQVSMCLPTGDLFRQTLLEGGFFPVHAAVLQSKIVRAIGAFDTTLSSLEDWDLWLRISEHYEMIAHPAVLAFYRIYPGTNSTDIARMHTNRLAVVKKLVGPMSGCPDDWPIRKRIAYGFVHQKSAIDYIVQGRVDEAWRLLAQGVTIWPPVLERIDTFYELACGNQPRGLRGQARLLDIDYNGAEMLSRLAALFETTDDSVLRVSDVAYGNAYLALSMLSDQAGRWPIARRYLLHAISANPQLLTRPKVLRRLFKLFAGQRIVNWFRSCQMKWKE